MEMSDLYSSRKVSLLTVAAHSFNYHTLFLAAGDFFFVFVFLFLSLNLLVNSYL